MSNTISTAPLTPKRYLSLDVLRGLTIALMVLVNTPGSWGTIYAPFRHAAWHGFTITDLVFPTFLFVVGNAMSFSMRKFADRSEGEFLQKVLRRSFFIFAIGLFLSAFPFVRWMENDLVFKDLSQMRIMGVLQRIALCYLIASLVVRYLNRFKILLLSVAALLAYWGILYWYGDPAAPYSLEGNAALKFDLLFIPPENLWNGFGIPFDPEGLLSTIPATVNVIAGYFVGLFLQKEGDRIEKILLLAASGSFLVVAGQVWDIVFPINKPLWTSSYVLLTVGWDMLIISVLILVIEVLNIKKWTYFFQVFGKNPLFIFVMSGIGVMTMNLLRVDGTSSKTWIYQNGYLSWLTDYNASLAFAFSYMLLMWLLGYWLDRNKIYIKI